MKKLFLTSLYIFIITSVCSAGTTSTNGYFYLPAKGASGASEWNTWIAVNEATDAVLKTCVDHKNDNTQAHSDYLLNNASDTTSGTLTATGGFVGDLTGTASECKAVDYGTAFPSTPATGDLFVVIDDSAEGACDSAAGSSVSLCRYSGADWVALGGGAGSGIDNLVEDLSPQLGADLDMNGKAIDFPSTPNITDVLDEDAMGSNSATKLATQQSIKAYVDGKTHLTQENVEDYAGAMATSNTETFITVAYQDTDGTMDYTVPVLDEDAMGSDSAVHLATQQSIKAYVDAVGNAQDACSELDMSACGAVVLTDTIQLYDAASVTVNDNGEMAFDTDHFAASHGAIKYYDGASNIVLVGALAIDTPTAGQVPTYKAAGWFEFETPSSTGITVGDTQVLFADGANNPAGDAGMTYDKTSNYLTVGGINMTPVVSPSITFTPSTAADTDFIMGVYANEGSDDDHFQIAEGTSLNSNVRLDIDTDGTVLIGTALELGTASNISGQKHHLRVTIPDPSDYYANVDTQVVIWSKTDAAITVTNIEVSCDINPTTELTGDLKYADTYIGLASPTVINAFDTADGVLSDSSITSGAVASGKAIYLQFDTTPDSAITQMAVDITYDYD